MSFNRYLFKSYNYYLIILILFIFLFILIFQLFHDDERIIIQISKYPNGKKFALTITDDPDYSNFQDT